MPGRELEIGLNAQHDIVVNFDVQDQGRTWHAVFTPAEACALANKLFKFADQAIQESRGEPTGGIGR